MTQLTTAVTEEDFQALADAAGNAYERGEFAFAHRLDELARRVNAVLSGNPDCQSPMEFEGYKERILEEIQVGA